MQGVVKVYDPGSGVGVIVRDDDRSEVYLRPGSLEGSMFRMLRQGQRVIFDDRRRRRAASTPAIFASGQTATKPRGAPVH